MATWKDFSYMFQVKASARHCDVVKLAQISMVLGSQGSRAARI